MIKDNMEKQGEFMSSKFVSIVLLLIGFIIVMLIFPALLNEKEVDREICHDSVLLRGALPDNLNLKEVANLKCTTRKVCLTSKTFGKGDCKDEKGFEKGEYETIRVSTGEDVNRFVARELAGCWSMMGNGEIQIFTRENSQKKSCVVCSRISFDKELKAELKNEVDGVDAGFLGDFGDAGPCRRLQRDVTDSLEAIISKVFFDLGVGRRIIGRQK